MKILSLLLITFICVTVIILVWFFIINFGSVKVTQNILKVTGLLFAALIFLLLDIYSTQNEYGENVNILIPRNEEDIEINEFWRKLTYIGSEHNGYDDMNYIMTFSKKNDSKEFSDEGQKALDLMEVTFWAWLSKKYCLHWQVETKNFMGISGGSHEGNVAENADKKVTTITKKELSDMFKDNYFKLPDGHVWELKLPDGATITPLERNSYERTYLIKTENIEFTVSIVHTGNSGISHTKLGDNILKTLPEGDWYSNNIRIEFSSVVNRFKIFSIETNEQIKWTNEIQDDFKNDFEWSLIKEDFEKIYNN